MFPWVINEKDQLELRLLELSHAVERRLAT